MIQLRDLETLLPYLELPDKEYDESGLMIFLIYVKQKRKDTFDVIFPNIYIWRMN